MAQDNPVFDITRVAEIDLSTDATPATSQRYRAVKLGTLAGQVNDLAADSDVVIGVQQNLPALGKQATVRVLGTTKARAAGVIAVNTYVKVDAAGKFVAGGGAADRNWGLALEAAAADGDIIEVLLTGLVVTA